MTYLNVIALTLLVVSPVLVPLVITGVHAIANWRQKYKRCRANAHHRVVPPAALRWMISRTYLSRGSLSSQ